MMTQPSLAKRAVDRPIDPTEDPDYEHLVRLYVGGMSEEEVRDYFVKRGRSPDKILASARRSFATSMGRK